MHVHAQFALLGSAMGSQVGHRVFTWLTLGRGGSRDGIEQDRKKSSPVVCAHARTPARTIYAGLRVVPAC